MAIDRTTAADTGSALIGLYSSLEARLIELVAQRLRSAVADPDSVQWAERHLRQTTELRTAAERLYRGLGREATSEAAAAILEAQTVGRRAALREMGARAQTPGLVTAIREASSALNSGIDLPGGGAIDQIARSLTGKLGALELPVTRWVSDVFQDVIFAGAVPGQLAGIDTRRQAAARAWNQLLNQGVTGMVDRSGRKWNLATYVEMSTRTATSQAAIEAHNGQLQTLGLSLVIVSDVPGECIICRPWEGKILTTSGAGGAQVLRVQRADNDDYVEVRVAGSVAEARAAGLFHPNCRHSIGAYFPGLTRIPTNTADPKLDEARRELRGLERESRKWKQREAGALTPEDAARARAKVAETSSKIKKLIAERGGVERGLPRRRDRELIDLGNKRSKPPTAGPAAKPTTPKPKPKPPAPTKPPATAPKPKPTKPAPAPKPAKVTPPAAPAKTGKGGPPNPQSPPPTKPRLVDPYERFDPPPGSKYFEPDKHPLVPKLPRKDARGVYEFSPGPVVDYGPTAHRPRLADVLAGRQHIDRLFGITAPSGRRHLPTGPQGDEIRAALELFGDLAPKSLLELRDVSAISLPRWQTHGGNSNAFYVVYDMGGSSPWRSLTINPRWYDPAGRNNLIDLKTYSYQTEWSAQGGFPGSGGTILHELGHHMQTMMYPGRSPITAYTIIDQRITDLLIQELGLIPRSPGGINSLSALGFGQMIHTPANQAIVKEMVSGYGASSFEEMFAEIFQEYATLGVNARPHIFRIGQAIVRLAETGAL